MELQTMSFPNRIGWNVATRKTGASDMANAYKILGDIFPFTCSKSLRLAFVVVVVVKFFLFFILHLRCGKLFTILCVILHYPEDYFHRNETNEVSSISKSTIYRYDSYLLHWCCCFIQYSSHFAE